MNILLGTCVLIVGIIVTMIRCGKGRLKKVLIICCILEFCLIYGNNINFRESIKTFVITEEVHYSVVNNCSYKVPLPAGTALRYRTTGTAATYITRATMDGIYKFYETISGAEIIGQNEEDVTARLEFLYQGNTFVVEIEDEGRKRKMIVDLLE